MVRMNTCQLHTRADLQSQLFSLQDMMEPETRIVLAGTETNRYLGGRNPLTRKDSPMGVQT